jgi:hypothetical protein
VSENSIKNLLKDFGLTETELEIYLQLAKQGTSKGTEVAKQLGKDKAQIYHILKSLQKKGLVESTFESPARFSPLPFEHVIETIIKIKKLETKRIQSAKKELLQYWKRMYGNKSEPFFEKFMVIEGQATIYSKIVQMIDSTQNELSLICSLEIMLNLANQGFFDDVLKNEKNNFCMLTNMEALSSLDVKKFLYLVDRGFSLRCTNPNSGKNPFPQMLIRDSEEALFLISSKNRGDNPQNLCIWTNSKALVRSFCLVFEDIWDISNDVSKNLLERNNGIPKTGVIKAKQKLKTDT